MKNSLLILYLVYSSHYGGKSELFHLVLHGDVTSVGKHVLGAGLLALRQCHRILEGLCNGHVHRHRFQRCCKRGGGCGGGGGGGDRASLLLSPHPPHLFLNLYIILLLLLPLFLSCLSLIPLPLLLLLLVMPMFLVLLLLLLLLLLPIPFFLPYLPQVFTASALLTREVSLVPLFLVFHQLPDHRVDFIHVEIENSSVRIAAAAADERDGEEIVRLVLLVLPVLSLVVLLLPAVG